ncbi:glycosyl hydrolase catalytic core-domain-containing protein [Xylariaceae sp. FL0255]|nr:glycosyl hydrolase catalytic core-domain-containing protein [Xylariaceae sp. FL0255]
MYSKASLMALCAAAAVKEVSAAHGHHHVHADKRDIVWAATETVVHTDWFTVTVTEGEGFTAASVPTSTKKHHHSVHTTSSSSSSSTTTTSSSVVPAEPSAPAPAPSSTTSSTTTTPSPTPTTTPVVQSVTPTTMATSTTTSSTETPILSTPTVTIPPVTIPTTTTTSSTSAIPTSTTVPASSGSKLGLAYNDVSFVQEFVDLGGHPSWAYDWGTTDAGDLPSGVTYVPMLWGTDADHSSGFPAAAEQAISLGDAYLLSFNEPDISSQANMAPATAAAAQIQWLNQYAGKASISAPAISSSESSGQGIDWLNQFFDACAGQCQIDFCVGHWYGPGGTSGASAFLQYVSDLHTACNNLPVWITEFQATSDDVDTFMSTVISAMNSDEYSYVDRYSYFMAAADSGDLFESATQLTSFGQIYAGLTS